MNLIEQLGGYEKAKEELKIRISKGFVYSVIELGEALLEYRRQHIAIDAYQRMKFTGFVLLLILTNKRLKTLHSKL